MRTTALLFVLAIYCQGSSQPPPKLLTEPQVTSATIAEAVNHYVAQGEAASIREFKTLIQKDERKPRRRFYVYERIGWLCRILFQAKGKEPLRPPRFGGLALPWLTMPFEKWPLYPVAQSGSVYFVLGEGYMVGGKPEDPSRYIEYCRDNGTFRAEPVPVPTREEAIRAADSLRRSEAWQSIVWTANDGNNRYSFSEQLAWARIQRQAESISP